MYKTEGGTLQIVEEPVWWAPLLTLAFLPSYNFERPGLQFLSSAVSAEFWIFSSLLPPTCSNQFLPVL